MCKKRLRNEDFFNIKNLVNMDKKLWWLIYVVMKNKLINKNPIFFYECIYLLFYGLLFIFRKSVKKIIYMHYSE